MTFKMSRNVCSFSWLFVLLSLPLAVVALPATSTFIVSYVDQGRVPIKSPSTNSKLATESFPTHSNPEMLESPQEIVVHNFENKDTTVDKVAKDQQTNSSNLIETLNNNEISYIPNSDDLMYNMVNTLEDGFGHNEQHESRTNDTMWQRTKQSIPVLEPVRHLLHSVRNGALNDTVRGHHQFLKAGGGVDAMDMMPHNGSDVSMAIETEEEREMINDSNDLKFLEVLGSLGSRLWGFLSSIKQVFAASSGSASAALSAQSSSTSS